jgi:ADP-heptose:LPS heptosyltransferase
MGREIIDFRRHNRILRGRTVFGFLSLLLSTVLCNIIGICLKILRLTRNSGKSVTLRQLVVLGFGGIGNHLMLVPVMTGLKQSHPELKVNVFVPSGSCAELLRKNPDIASVSVLDIGTINGFARYFRAGRALSSLKPDVVLAAAGTDPVAGSLISFFSGAPLRVGEDWKGRGFLYTHKIKAKQTISELQQNVSLAKFLGGKVLPSLPLLYLSPDEVEEGRRWIGQQKIPAEAKILGIHPGCGREQEWKRWEIDRYIGVSKEITTRDNVWSIFFFGPDEDDLISSVEAADAGAAVIYRGQGSIRKTAAIIGCCDLFLSNDRPTSIEKNSLGGDKHKAVFQEKVVCRPCHYTRWWLACGDQRPCLRLISANDLVTILLEMLSQHSIVACKEENDRQ